MLEITNLTKKYDRNKGIFELNYSFEDGRIYALVGPNGAGKDNFNSDDCGHK